MTICKSLASVGSGAVAAMIALVAWTPPLPAADWSNTELHLQYGTLDTPGFAGGGEKDTFIVTVHHASGWKYGDNFLFIDFLDARGAGFNDSDVYAEWYSNFSLGKMRGKKVGAGRLADVGLIAAFNYGAEPKVLKYLPGIRLSWDVPGMAFFNTDITAYIDASEGAASGGAPAQDDSFHIDVNWLYPFEIGGAKFSIEGHVEYIGSRTNEFGGDVSDWILGQPQFRYYASDNFAIGVEWQFWINKLGDEDTDENAFQALVVWKF